jgi:DNA-binding NarL/FixJ family response regulator
MSAAADKPMHRALAECVGKLTPRQAEVFLLRLEGASASEIGQRLKVAKRTAKYHGFEILKRLSERRLSSVFARLILEALKAEDAEAEALRSASVELHPFFFGASAMSSAESDGIQ